MNKYLFIAILSMCYGFTVYGNSCLDSITGTASYIVINDQTIACMSEESEFIDSLSYLCKKENGYQIPSDIFTKYLNFEIAYKKAYNKRRNDTSIVERT